MNKLRAWAEDARHAVHARTQRRFHEVGIALGCLHLAVPQKAPDDLEGGATGDQERSDGVAQVVDAHIR